MRLTWWCVDRVTVARFVLYWDKESVELGQQLFGVSWNEMKGTSDTNRTRFPFHGS